MAFAPSASWNSRSITHLANYPSPSLPMIFSDESKSLCRDEFPVLKALGFQEFQVACTGPAIRFCGYCGDGSEADSRRHTLRPLLMAGSKPLRCFSLEQENQSNSLEDSQSQRQKK